MDSVHDDREREEDHVDDAWIRANSGRKRGFLGDASNDAPHHDAGRCSSERACGGPRGLQGGFFRRFLRSRWNRQQSLDRSASRGGAENELHMGSCVSIPGSHGCTKSVGHAQCESLYEFQRGRTITIRRFFSTDLNHFENTSRRKQEDTSMTF